MLLLGPLYTYKRFILRSAWNELRNRYAGSGIGAFWNILVPLIQISIYIFIFSTIMSSRIAPRGVATVHQYPFVLFLCSGMLPWLSFSEAVAHGTQSLVRNASYLKRMALPEIIFIAQSALIGFLTASISLTLFVVVGWMLGLVIGWTYLLIPLVLLLFQGLGFGVALVLSVLNVLFRDIGQAIVLLLPMWMWLTPIIYTEQILPPAGRALLPWNPAYGFITAFRDIFLANQVPAASTWGLMLGWVAVSLTLGWLVLARLRHEIRDVL